MKHTIKTPQGTISLEAIGQKGDPAVLVTVQKAGFPIAFPFSVRPEDAAVLHSCLGLVLEELAPKAHSECVNPGRWCHCGAVCKAAPA